MIAENAKEGVYNETFDRQYQRISEEINDLKERQLETRRGKKLSEDYEQRVKEMDGFLRSNTQKIPEFDDDLVRRLVKGVKVLSANSVMIQFKSGIVMKEELRKEN